LVFPHFKEESPMTSQPEPACPHESAHHGIAAIALGGVLLLMAFPAFQMAFWLEMSGYRGWSRSDKEMAAYGGYVGAGVVEVLAVTGIVIGLRGVTAAGRTGEPRVLSLVGILMNLFAAAIWVMVVVAWHSQAAGFIRSGADDLSLLLSFKSLCSFSSL
jgi:hypothetical protein